MADEQEKNKTEEAFEEICSEIKSNIGNDRQGLREIIENLDRVGKTLPEMLPMIADVAVKAYDTLNKMNSHLVSIAALYRKKAASDKPKNEDIDGIYDAIGDEFSDGTGH